MTTFFTSIASANNAKRVMVSAALALVMATSMASQARADWDDHHGRGYGHDHDRPHFAHERPLGHYEDHHRFYGYNDRYWRGGRWMHAYHQGRPGWWWVVGNRWYSYAAPVYPYPVNPYVEDVVVVPPPTIMAPAPEPYPAFNLIIPLNIR